MAKFTTKFYYFDLLFGGPRESHLKYLLTVTLG